MCGLFGVYNYSKEKISGLSVLTNKLAQEAAERGVDATGISYNCNANLVIHKEPKSAFQMKFKHPDNTVAVMGHTRHSTHGSEKDNYNNHPFMGKCKNLKFTLAHNGIISNYSDLREKYKIQKTKIETDSYIAVQMIENKDVFCDDSIKFMAENIHGSFSFTILTEENELYFIKGDSPIKIVHFPKYSLYVYASTDKILYKAIIETSLFEELKKGNYEEIEISEGDILKISPDGTISKDIFEFVDYSAYGIYDWRSYGDGYYYDNDDYLTDLKDISRYYGYEPEDIDNFIREGFTLEEIEEYICS